ncbi:MAG TPA: T9SS type A sorting domain-containing protein [Bacteroidetes bacterium]|nr:T9SS type A sorting domain-containing protein [Bacteroidota bacterium]
MAHAVTAFGDMEWSMPPQKMSLAMKTRFITIAAFAAILTILSAPQSPFAADLYFHCSVSGDSVGDRFFHIARGHGDVNGDGYEDVLIGAPYGGTSGYAKLYYGGAEFDTIPDLVFYGEEYAGIASHFGESCAFIGDINNDDFDDILIGAPATSISYYENGKAYLYLGSAEMDTVPDLTFIGEDWYHRLGENVSGAGDVNNDGYDDWLISAPWDCWGYGRIYLYYGSADPDPICDVYFVAQDFLRFKDAQLGDINGDGYDDLAFYKLDGGLDFLIIPQIHFGSPQMDTIPDLRWPDDLYFDYFAVSGVGDINCDGYNDWAIGFYNDYKVYFGDADPDTTPDMVLTPEDPIDRMAYAICGADVNNDGVSDLLTNGIEEVGDHNYSYVLTYCGGENLDESYDYIFDVNEPDLAIGYTLGAADIYADSIVQILAGGFQDSYDSDPGQVWFLSVEPPLGMKPINPMMPPAYDLIVYPNPFNPTTTINYALPKACEVKLIVYDIQGCEIRTLVNQWQNPGIHEVTFNGSDLASGIYVYHIEAGEYERVNKMVLLK